MTRLEVACVGRHTDGVEAEVGWLCAACFSRLRSGLVALPAVVSWLWAFAATSSTPGERITGSADPSMPLRGDVLDLVGPSAPNRARADRQAWIAGTWDDQVGDFDIATTLRDYAERIHWDGGFPWPDDTTVAVAAVWVATDPDTQTPARLAEPGPWWAAPTTTVAPRNPRYDPAEFDEMRRRAVPPPADFRERVAAGIAAHRGDVDEHPPDDDARLAEARAEVEGLRRRQAADEQQSNRTEATG